jgi:hypothetical protein
MNVPMVQETQDERDENPLDQEDVAPRLEMPLGIVVARIVVVSGMSFAAAFAIFFLVGGFFLIAAAAFVATLVFLGLMFAIERSAERP